MQCQQAFGFAENGDDCGEGRHGEGSGFRDR
jgi:hypothetical protein